MTSGASNFVETVDNVFLLSVIICVFFMVLITALIIVFSIKYNRKKNKKAVNIHGHALLEITWTTIPTILVLILFWYGWVGYMKMVDVPENAMTVQVTAQMQLSGFFVRSDNAGSGSDQSRVNLEAHVHF